jgi:hypothetical protein
MLSGSSSLKIVAIMVQVPAHLYDNFDKSWPFTFGHSVSKMLK